MALLPAEIMQRIIEFLVRDERRQFMTVKEVHENDLTKLLRVSKTMYELTAPILYESIAITNFPLFAVGIQEPEICEVETSILCQASDSASEPSYSRPSGPWTKRYLVDLIKKVELVYQDPDSTLPQVLREPFSLPVLKHVLTLRLSPSAQGSLASASVCQVRERDGAEPIVEIQHAARSTLLPKIEVNSVHHEPYRLEWQYLMPGIHNRLFITTAGRDEYFCSGDGSFMGMEIEGIVVRFEEFWKMPQWGVEKWNKTSIEVVCPYTLVGWDLSIFSGHVWCTGGSEVKDYEDEAEPCQVCRKGCLPAPDGSTYEDCLEVRENGWKWDAESGSERSA